ncbi:MAG: hypothetical protein A3C85_04670 [Candidatus Doudnabacteria bacterium RIFCSPHIGHO2_02_FULL_48_21]|uniref:Mannosyl-glycoprotein endo-beta-N-acetylglucosamidase-like domain-containing protein n=1 Tax=Candidatus Doudnabacteria bacterium RIFCSPLOWO2_02_FULL_48_13 TaxID=1817845 RepID=A0A1F5QD83_9BACT|nr:MAG: hypothetical protein A3K05_02960 [Candidatus Doudnabacteria bacterium RIFCSPHIGHO2_01_48_18]OGE78093.1 MAG: hypothetical protein A2668_02865 [Candidatus Doudnabacteria bacterium RIFCSPHIGHO2_01_FULL_48_180]OGE91908.1 MAG: hypothetical protein A3F44_03855 [Candidatus Doudnabacteria bacterium RIFCSPHIGHO2_12_FULL_47_25]OGE93510.1 MAG: hypothetical protein A3C85_04670 [Candidatus Doudnabacteria bacterium RIFCSPHIGHO2_02_FULL_48_21]OGE97755.1 MAG: hypothetical protein A3A83_04215 [Candidatu
MNTTNFTAKWGSIDIKALRQLTALEKIFIGASLIGVISWSLAPHAALAQSTPDYKPFVFSVALTDIDQVIFGEDLVEAEALAHEPVIDPRVEPLREYLESKSSPMAPFAEELLKHRHYRLIIGISFAESNFCKRNIRPHNCWGIGGGKPETYKDYAHAFARANQLIQKYHDGGLTTPALMRNRWVGWKNDGWIRAVNQVTLALEQKGI